VSDLVLLTSGGFGKRIPLSAIPCKRRARAGVKVSSAPLAAACVVNAAPEVVIVSKHAVVERVATKNVPVRAREVRSGGTMSKGSKVMKLDTADEVANIAAVSVLTHPNGNKQQEWPAGRVGLEDGENAAQVHVFRPRRELSEIDPNGAPAVARAEWAQTDVHKASRYFCAHCGAEHEDPEAAYGCIASHSAESVAVAA
jgi:DNA gyrase C-terminal domain, beta-propeller